MATSLPAQNTTAAATLVSLEEAIKQRLERIINPFPTLRQQYSDLSSDERSAFEAFASRYPYYLEGREYGDCIKALADVPDVQQLARQYRFAHQLVRFFDEFKEKGDEGQFRAAYLRQESSGRTLLANLRNNSFSFDELVSIAAEARPELSAFPNRPVVASTGAVSPVSKAKKEDKASVLFPRSFETLVQEALWELELGNRFPAFEDVFDFENQYREQILQSHDGRSKLERLAEASGFLADEGFTAYHAQQIVRGKGWQQRLSWVTANYAPLKEAGFKPSHVAKIIRGKDWDKKLDWIAHQFAFYRALGLTPARLAISVYGADWSTWVTQLEEKRELLSEIHIDDERISPLVESYLLRLAFNHTDRNTLETLIDKATYESIEQFKENLTIIAGKEHAHTAEKVIDHLNTQFGYTPEEIRLYLIGLNKNLRGLVSWYNTGNMYAGREKAMSDTAERTAASAELSPEEQLEQSETRNHLLGLLRQEAPRHYSLFHHLLVDYGGNIEAFNPDEVTQFNDALNQIRSNKLLMAELYELLD